jgi:hypothetical protein
MKSSVLNRVSTDENAWRSSALRTSWVGDRITSLASTNLIEETQDEVDAMECRGPAHPWEVSYYLKVQRSLHVGFHMTARRYKVEEAAFRKAAWYLRTGEYDFIELEEHRDLLCFTVPIWQHVNPETVGDDGCLRPDVLIRWGVDPRSALERERDLANAK